MKIPDTMKQTGAVSPFTGTLKPGQMKSGRPKQNSGCRRGQEEERGGAEGGLPALEGSLKPT